MNNTTKTSYSISQRLLFGVEVVAWILFAISISIAIPLLWRGFYYLHIEPLSLSFRSGYTNAEIKEAYDRMMDFCIFGKSFSTGALKYSTEGMQHFADCAVLFRLDLIVAVLSTLFIGLLFLYRKKNAIEIKGGRFWAGIITVISFILITITVSLDFDRAFIIFHQLFFPGKDNWLFNPETDEIITILPEEFFRNCAILIVCTLFGICLALILTDRPKNQTNPDLPQN